MRPTIKRRLRIAATFCAAILGCVLFLEIALRGAGCYYQDQFWDAYARQQPTEEWVTLLALGESTTAGLWLDLSDSYPKQLERQLRAHYQTDRIRVLIPPHLGQNSSQMLKRFPQYLSAARPSMVLIMAGVNNGWSLAESNLGQFMPAGDWRTHAFRLRRWSDNVKLVRLTRLAAAGSGETWSEVRRDLAGRPRFTPWPPEDDPLVRGIGQEPFIRLWRSDVGQIIAASQQAGVAVILMTYPNYDTPPLSEFTAMAQAWSVPLVENHRTFDELIEQGRAEEFFFEDLRHPNASGYRLVADNAFRAVVATGVLDSKLD